MHQFHAGSALGDGVTNSMFFIRRLLRQMGLESRIYVHHRDARLGEEIEDAGDLSDTPGQLLLVHHSMGHDLQDWLCKLRMPRILVWHNITPPELLELEESRAYARMGFGFLERFRPHAQGAIANSSFSAKELTSRGWAEAEVVPLLVDLDRYRDHTEGPIRSIEEAVQGRRVLFVGRVMRHKNQLGLVELADRLRAAGMRDFTVDLVGGAPQGDAYAEEVRERIAALRLGGRVVLHGHLSDERLRSLYRSADLYCSLSEHEGFGMPLIEAMASNVAVVAYRSSSIETTLGGSGVPLDSADPDEAAKAVLRLLREPDWRRGVVRSQRARLRELEPETLGRRLADILARHGVQLRLPPQAAPPPSFQVEGPCETDYSLAIVNRELARALDRIAPGRTAALPIEGPGGYVADQAALRRMPDVGHLVARARHRPGAAVVLRNLYPPRVHDMDGDVNLLQLAWEESLIPSAWVAAFNRWLDGVVVPSRFTARMIRDSGVACPIEVAPHGVSHALVSPRTVPEGPRPGQRTFLHVSSCFPRKGADLLLAAYREAFTAADPVELLIKTFPNPHNDIAVKVAALAQDPGHPKVRVIDRELSANEMADLYTRSHVLVAPSRGEGFGLPVAEAMAHGLPVIVTGESAMTEFVPDQAGVKLRWRWAPSRSHVAQPGSLWQEPELPHLVQALREMAALPAESLTAMGRAGKEHVSRTLSWDAAAARIARFSSGLASAPAPTRTPRIGWVSTWNIRCGIATYSHPLVRELRAAGSEVTVLAKAAPGADDENGVVRCWGAELSGSDMERIAQEAQRLELDAVVVQFQFGLYHRPALARALAELLDRGIAVVMTLHSVRDVIREGRTVASLDELGGVLGRVDRLLVHSVNDVNLLVDRGLRNVTLFPHGCEARPAVDAQELRQRIGIGDRPVVGMFGFLLPNKGVLETLEGWPRVLAKHPRAILLLATSLFDAPESAETLQRCKAAIERLGLQDSVVQITEFLPEEEAAILLEACDLTLFPYRQSAEGASGAVRLALAAHRPVLCTRQPIFDDLANAVEFLDGDEPEAIAVGVSRALSSPEWRKQAVERQQRWVQGTCWPILASRLDGLLRGLVHDRHATARAEETAAPNSKGMAGPPRARPPAVPEGDADLGRAS